MHKNYNSPQAGRLHPRDGGWFNIQKSVNVLHYINKLKEKTHTHTHMVISLDVE